jgi:hypothetical protein
MVCDVKQPIGTYNVLTNNRCLLIVGWECTKDSRVGFLYICIKIDGYRDGKIEELDLLRFLDGT